MERRQFIQTVGAASALCAGVSNAQSPMQTLGDAALRLNPLIQPEERVEKRVYDHSKEPGVVWYSAPQEMSYPKKIVMRTVGFVEAVSEPDKILHIPGLLVRRDVPQTTKPGFYLYFGVSFVWLSLPRRTSKSSTVDQDRYAFAEQFSVKPTVGNKHLSYEVDFRKMRITVNNSVYYPSHEVFREVVDDAYTQAPPVLRTLGEPKPSSLDRVSSDIEKILFFDISQRPLRFTLELPPIIIQGIEVLLPTCYFEPFDLSTNKWY